MPLSASTIEASGTGTHSPTGARREAQGHVRRDLALVLVDLEHEHRGLAGPELVGVQDELRRVAGSRGRPGEEPLSPRFLHPSGRPGRVAAEAALEEVDDGGHPEVVEASLQVLGVLALVDGDEDRTVVGAHGRVGAGAVVSAADHERGDEAERRQGGSGEADAAPATVGDHRCHRRLGLEVMLDLGHQNVLHAGEPASGKVSLRGNMVICHDSSSTFREARSSFTPSVSVGDRGFPSSSVSRARARARRDRTVPTGTSSTVAASR